MKQTDNKKCHTHTYLTREEENSFARLILKEFDRNANAKPLPAPSGLADLIF